MNHSEAREHLESLLVAGRPDQAFDTCADWAEDGDYTRKRAARRLLPHVAGRLPWVAVDDRREARLHRLGLKAPSFPGAPSVGQFSFPVVAAGVAVGAQERFVEVEVQRLADGDGVSSEDDLPTELNEATRAAVRDALTAARDGLGQQRAKVSVRFHPHGGWEGPSCGLAVALAAWSALTGQPATPLRVASARVDPTGAVRPVGAIPAKTALLQAARPRARLLVSEEDHTGAPHTVAVAHLAAAASQLGLADDLNLADRLEEVRRLFRTQGDWARARDHAELLVDDPHLSPEQLVELWITLLAAANHAADPASQRRWAARLAQAPPELDKTTEALCHHVVTCVDQLDPASALALLDRIEPPHEGHVLRIHREGSHALVRTLLGHHDHALALRRENVERAARHPGELPRTLGDLSDALRRVGQVDEALVAADEAFEALRNPRVCVHLRSSLAAVTSAFLTVHRAHALVASGRQGEALAVLTPEALSTMPPHAAFRGRLLRAELGGDLEAVRRFEAEEAARGPLGIKRVVLDRSLARLGDREAEARLLAQPVFAGLALEEIALRIPY